MKLQIYFLYAVLGINLFIYFKKDKKKMEKNTLIDNNNNK